MMFASRTLTEHLLRGLVGLGALVAAVALAPRHPWLALALLPVSLLALRGCPACWLTGLYQTLLRRGPPPSCPVRK